LIRFYIVRKVVAAVNGITATRAKYSVPDALGQGWDMHLMDAIDYGLEDVFVVACDLDQTNHQTLAGQADVLAIPSPITNLITAGALPTVQAKLEAGNIPAHYVTTAFTYQQVMATSLRIVTIMQRFRGLFGQLFTGGVTLDTTIGALPTNARQALAQAAQELGADTSGITGATLIREALVDVGNQTYPDGLSFGGVTF
jgi:hypothetical protein